MRASSETYTKVAERCSEFKPAGPESSFRNSSSEDYVSCQSCNHFDEDEYCQLDLYDEIIQDSDLSK